MINIEALFKISYGLYVVSAAKGNDYTGHISNTFFQVTAEPPKAAICSAKENLTTEYIRSSKAFSVSALEQDVDLKFIGHYGFNSGRNIKKFAGTNYKIGTTGSPILLDKTIAFFECKVVQEIDVGTHIMFIGEIVDAEIVDASKTPLSYDYYRKVIKGVAPKTSPTYIAHDKLEKAAHHQAAATTPPPTATAKTKTTKWQCVVCGFIYDPEEGDPDSGIAPGTAFEDIPNDWICPVCGVSKSDFEKIED